MKYVYNRAMNRIHATIKDGRIVPDEPLPAGTAEAWIAPVDTADEEAWRAILDDPTPSPKLSAMADDALRGLEEGRTLPLPWECEPPGFSRFTG